MFYCNSNFDDIAKLHMDKSLRYISISHKTASTEKREKYHISDAEKKGLANLVCNYFSDVSGLLLLSTCNRMEIYFESNKTSAKTILDFLMNYKSVKNTATENSLFFVSDSTKETINHLLQVSSGLESLVLGDAEIISQIKKAHQFSMANKIQGSLLERALQAVFKTHKRISNETNFRDGTTSVAYKSLKVIRDAFDKASVKTKKILFIGAGDIVKQLFKYNSKFNFNNIYISNRNKEKALMLSQNNNSKTYPWDKVIENQFDDFDVIVSAVSNCPKLIKEISILNNKTLLIDLAVPCNIDKSISKNDGITLHDLDSISVELEETKKHRLTATDSVNKIISEETTAYFNWYQEAPLRKLLAQFKISVTNRIKTHFETNIDHSNIAIVTNQVMKKLVVKNETSINSTEIDALISEEISLLNI
jgi:glutamyl-tRNA reductase